MSKELTLTLLETVANDTLKKVTKNVFSTQAVLAVNKGKTFHSLNSIFQLRQGKLLAVNDIRFLKFIFVKNIEFGLECTTIKRIDALEELLVCLEFLVAIFGKSHGLEIVCVPIFFLVFVLNFCENQVC